MIRRIFELLMLVVFTSCGTSTGPNKDNKAPTNLIAYNTINDQIQLTWQDNNGLRGKGRLELL